MEKEKTTVLVLPYPVSNNRYYRKFKNITVLSPEGRSYKEFVKWKYRKIKPTNDEIEIEIIVNRKMTKDGRDFKKVIDIDNPSKGILDSLIGVIYHDDKQVKKHTTEYGDSNPAGDTVVRVKQYTKKPFDKEIQDILDRLKKGEKI
jgi:crossover junction endodeoxyribonuclease RusA